MTRAIGAVLVVSLCSAVTLSGQDQKPSSLRASAERAAIRLASEFAATDVSFEVSANVSAPLTRAQRSDDWGAVQALKQGTRVRVVPRQGIAVTGKVTAVGPTAVSTDSGAFLRDEIAQIYRARFSQSLGVLSYVGLGALAGGVTGYVAGNASYDCLGCGEQRLAASLGLIGGSFLGGMGGFITGEVVHHLPEHIIYSRGQP